jgi:hypothetical protein
MFEMTLQSILASEGHQAQRKLLPEEQILFTEKFLIHRAGTGRPTVSERERLNLGPTQT